MTIKTVLSLLAFAWGMLSALAFGETNANITDQYNRAVLTSATWGVETNGIQFGVDLPWSRMLLSSNRLNVSTYLLNTSSSNRYALLLPPHGGRLELTLKSVGGTTVEKTPKGSALCRTLPVGPPLRSNRVILHTKSPEEFDAPFNLLECFHVKVPGTYTLTVKGMLYSLTVYPHAVQVPLPETSIRVVVTLADLEK